MDTSSKWVQTHPHQKVEVRGPERGRIGPAPLPHAYASVSTISCWFLNSARHTIFPPPPSCRTLLHQNPPVPIPKWDWDQGPSPSSLPLSRLTIRRLPLQCLHKALGTYKEQLGVAMFAVYPCPCRQVNKVRGV